MKIVYLACNGGGVYYKVEEELIVNEITQYVLENIPTHRLDKLYKKHVHKGVEYIIAWDLWGKLHVLLACDYELVVAKSNKVGLSV